MKKKSAALNMTNISIRKVDESDILELQELGKQTFLEAFGDQNTAADMAHYLNSAFSIEQLQSELCHPDSQFLFLKEDEKTIGYLKVNWGEAQTEKKLASALEIHRIYVQASYQGKGLGQLLFSKTMEIAREKNMKRVWLGVWEKNLGAIRFYERNGFVEFARHQFWLGKDEQTDIMMVLNME